MSSSCTVVFVIVDHMLFYVPFVNFGLSYHYLLPPYPRPLFLHHMTDFFIFYYSYRLCYFVINYFHDVGILKNCHGFTEFPPMKTHATLFAILLLPSFHMYIFLAPSILPEYFYSEILQSSMALPYSTFPITPPLGWMVQTGDYNLSQVIS